MPEDIFVEPIARHVWQTKYRLAAHGTPPEPDLSASWDRVAMALSAAEQHHRDDWRRRFRHALAHFRFLPGGRILAGAGTQRRATLFNCFVVGPVPDSIAGIFSALGESMLTMQQGGGIGCDFSCLRPAGSEAPDTGNTASGPVSFMQIWDAACATLTSTGLRRGAMMATLRCDHPDIADFIDAKRQPGTLPHFNLSVLVTDALVRAVEGDEPWPLVFPVKGRSVPAAARLCERTWSGSDKPETCRVHATVPARALWERLQRAAFDDGDPGVVFIDRVREADNLWYAETICATNPCGEVPLPAHGACNLGSINLVSFVREPFGRHPALDFSSIADTATIAVRMLDNVYEISGFPLKSQEKTARASRRVGLGITGLADALAMLGVRYGSAASFEIAEAVMRTICHAAYRSSAALARERGAFPAFRAREHLRGAFIRSLPQDIVDAIRDSGIRNSHLTAIAPAGSISLLANNVSSGIEPIFALRANRHIHAADGNRLLMQADDYAWSLFRRLHGPQAGMPASLVAATDVPPQAQLAMQARLQAYVDQAISKTINIAASAGFEDYRDIFLQAYRLGLKGCTIYRPRQETDAVLSAAALPLDERRCQ